MRETDGRRERGGDEVRGGMEKETDNQRDSQGRGYRHDLKGDRQIDRDNLRERERDRWIDR